jgi:hypothetical protein
MPTTAIETTTPAQATHGAGLVTSRARDAARVRRMAQWMDNRLLDPLVGVVAPGVGDVVGLVFGLYTVALAVKHRMAKVVIARMLFNLSIDAALGAIPLVGDVFDIVFQAHKKNAELFLARHQTGRASPRDWLVLGLAVLALLAAIAIPIYLIARLIAAVVP